MRPERAENDLKGLVCPEVHKASDNFLFFSSCIFREHVFRKFKGRKGDRSKWTGARDR